jgi:ferredoxin/flavodoxin---NADP+ reductase
VKAKISRILLDGYLFVCKQILNREKRGFVMADTQQSASNQFAIPAGVYAETVTQVTHYTDRLFRFRITRPPSFRFRSGEFVMIGLPNAEKPVFRAYSIASPSWDEEVEFYSIKVPDGPLTEHLQKIRVGDTVLMRKKSTGTLVNDALLPGKRLYMFATGTGIAPFASLIRDPETYQKFAEVILCHCCRTVAELSYGKALVASLADDPIVGDCAAQLTHYTTTTREDYPFQGRLTDLMASGKMFTDLGLPPISPAEDRGMICGSMEMLRDVKSALEGFGLEEGSNNRPATFVVERAFVD